MSFILFFYGLFCGYFYCPLYDVFIVPFIGVLISSYGYFYFDSLTNNRDGWIYFKWRRNIFFKLQHFFVLISNVKRYLDIDGFWTKSKAIDHCSKCGIYLFLIKFESNIFIFFLGAKKKKKEQQIKCKIFKYP